MKLTASGSWREQGFALPTILLVSVIMMTVLIAAIGAAAGSRVALDSQYYNELARQAAESGITRANECLRLSGYTPLWSTAASGKDLRPNTDCAGKDYGYSAYIIDRPDLRTIFSVDSLAPTGYGIGHSAKVTGTTELLRNTTNKDGTRDVWRRYDYVTYLRIDPPETSPCPDENEWAAVPGNPAFGTSDFCVMRFEARNVNGVAVSQAWGTPYVNISQSEAILAAKSACDGCHLLTEGEWLTIAHNVMHVNNNWNIGFAGTGGGYMFTGHSDGSPNYARDALWAEDNIQGYYGTGNAAGGAGEEQRRTLSLSNGQIIWDFAGNVWEWTSGLTPSGSGHQPGVTGGGYAWRYWNTLTGAEQGDLTPGIFPWTAEDQSKFYINNGLPQYKFGKLYSSADETKVRAFRRGGAYDTGTNDALGQAGVFAVDLNNDPNTSRYANTGFRVAR